MIIELRHIKGRELFQDYLDDGESGVTGYSGALNIRPPFQREFVYNSTQRDAVIDTIFKGFPLNVMYWAETLEGDYELIDGQQRTISICQFVDGIFSVKAGGFSEPRNFFNLRDDEQEKILNYELTIYFCKGSESEKLEWFKTINIAGEKLTDQELRNAVYSGPWVTSAKRYFSRSGCPASGLGEKYLRGSPIRQDYLETTLKWISDDKIEAYMSSNQKKNNAVDLWNYFQNVISWIDATFIKYRIEMKGVPWGELFNGFKDVNSDPKILEDKIASLMVDDDVTNKKGIYSYVLSGNEKILNIRNFSANQKREAYERQNGSCPSCKKNFLLEEMHGDHIKPWSKNGKTNSENCQMLCAHCNRRKSFA